MTQSLGSFIVHFGYPLIVAGIMAENLGIPLPGEFLILAAVSMAGSGKFSMEGVILSAALGALIGDHLSFLMGRKAGSKLIDLYCHVTWCSRHCSSMAHRFFQRYGTLTLVFARYLVGVQALAVPMAGMSGVSYRRFAFFDAAGSLLWATLVALAGRFLGTKLLAWAAATHNLGLAVAVLTGLMLLTISAYKFWRVRKYGPARLLTNTVPLSQSLDSGTGPALPEHSGDAKVKGLVRP
jgi:membrane protein DedA with SNARE-associated domain